MVNGWLDLKKAFYTVNHSSLVNKLDHYGIRGTENGWFSDYLAERHQVASINGILSDPLLINTGVPQWSILGPLLFVLYINDLPSCRCVSEVNMYAVDTAFYFSGTDVLYIKDKLQTDLNNLHGWINANKLSLNVSKTNSMLICSNRNKAHLQMKDMDLAIQCEHRKQVDWIILVSVYILNLILKVTLKNRSVNSTVPLEFLKKFLLLSIKRQEKSLITHLSSRILTTALRFGPLCLKHIKKDGKECKTVVCGMSLIVIPVAMLLTC